MIPAAHIDHLVVAAHTLAEGVAWCEATLGVTPRAGGFHALMGTHNRLLRIATSAYPRAYFEIIAIDPQAPAPKRRRWFDLDDPALQHAVLQHPRLVHFVARTAHAAGALDSLRRLGIDRGPLLRAERPTPEGMLQWQISVRPDGQRLFYGALPTLIEWGGTHPADAMPDSGLALQSLQVRHPRAEDLAAAHAAIGLQGVTVEPGPPHLVATLTTPKGLVTLDSGGA
ncbi:MAG TPA: VOC family protein [Ramlibacter sp.]|nr:VOC family protein [Ramlibacter sp.]